MDYISFISWLSCNHNNFTANRHISTLLTLCSLWRCISFPCSVKHFLSRGHAGKEGSGCQQYFEIREMEKVGKERRSLRSLRMICLSFKKCRGIEIVRQLPSLRIYQDLIFRLICGNSFCFVLFQALFIFLHYFKA